MIEVYVCCGETDHERCKAWLQRELDLVLTGDEPLESQPPVTAYALSFVKSVVRSPLWYYEAISGLPWEAGLLSLKASVTTPAFVQSVEGHRPWMRTQGLRMGDVPAWGDDGWPA